MFIYWPQGILLTLMIFALGSSASTHGKPGPGTDNFWFTLLAISGQTGLLYWGGFFSPP